MMAAEGRLHEPRAEPLLDPIPPEGCKRAPMDHMMMPLALVPLAAAAAAAAATCRGLRVMLGRLPLTATVTVFFLSYSQPLPLQDAPGLGPSRIRGQARDRHDDNELSAGLLCPLPPPSRLPPSSPSL